MGHSPAEDFYQMVWPKHDCNRKRGAVLTDVHRLNTKIAVRRLEVKDLVKDLSDGVCPPRVL